MVCRLIFTCGSFHERTRMTPYPTTLDTADFAALLAVLRGDLSNPKHKIHAAWDLVGYGLGQMVPDAAPPATTAVSDEAYFVSVAEAHVAGTHAAAAIDWLRLITYIVTTILPLILKTP